MTPLRIRATDEERMDAPDLDAATYRAVLGDLARANRWTLAARPTLAFLDRTVGDRRRFRLLDVGFGQGDMLRRIVAWADARGIEAECVGIDLNPNSEAAARDAGDAGGRIAYRTGDYAALAGGGWDLVVSSLVAHHMGREELIAFLRFMEDEAIAGWFVNDLHRHRAAHLGWPVLAGIMRWHPIVRHDGRLSIARAYRPAEWTALLADAGVTAARIEHWAPFRLCVARVR